MSGVTHLSILRNDSVTGWVSIRHGLEHKVYSCDGHQNVNLALQEELTGDPIECFSVVGLRKKDSTGLPIKYPLYCFFCVDMKEPVDPFIRECKCRATKKGLKLCNGCKSIIVDALSSVKRSS